MLSVINILDVLNMYNYSTNMHFVQGSMSVSRV